MELRTSLMHQFVYRVVYLYSYPYIYSFSTRNQQVLSSGYRRVLSAVH